MTCYRHQNFWSPVYRRLTRRYIPHHLNVARVSIMSGDPIGYCQVLFRWYHPKYSAFLNIDKYLRNFLTSFVFYLISSSNPCDDSLDCIVLFTDGETNTGLEDAEQLIQNFKAAHEKLNKKHSIPLSALTIGQYMPVLLTQVLVCVYCVGSVCISEAGYVYI